MNTGAPTTEADAPAIPAGLRTLWSEARNWVGWLLGMFDRKALRTTGVSRQHGARIGIWLMGVEGAMRRLIFAAALAFTPPVLRTRAAAPRAQPAAPSPRRSSFRVFRVHTGETTSRTQTRRAQPPRPYGHIPFPSDPLLRLGIPPRRPVDPACSAAPRARNPLDRWVRLSRQDPDWRAPDEMDRPPGSLQRFAPLAAHRRRLPRAPQSHDALPEGLADWRRRHDEWRRVIPAPGLAARLDALERIAGNPAAAIARAARHLRRAQNMAAQLARDAVPRCRPPGRAAHIATAGHTDDFNERCHLKLVFPDTS